ncbi:hypothetical protein HPC49_15095 [Pyxidicoccus fallax]|uniref:Uncharacterized protein n=1 Tax=Pyxidicoccus fallax TaxID=394095 RepID=A0A848LMG3_9BACT|nr:hypothetical protein [Pyxidicoccus fallax]NMO18901.1 hypothetical protein [Pyxidicoccus fallax]NPC79557.1 hypothetical protein [Pyxidicoccus fallax]
MRQRVCILREPTGLVALVLPNEAEASALVRVPLQQLSETESPGRSELLASWEALAQTRGATPETLVHVLRLVLGTTPGDEVPSRTLGHPWVESPPAPFRRTAAHPRGYRGTIHQPPKRRQPEVLDVRLHLLHRRDVQALLQALRPCLSEAVRRLESEGHDGERLRRMVAALESSGRADAALAYHHGFIETRGAELPSSFIRLGQLLSTGPEGSFARLLALRGTLAIDTRPVLYVAAARMLLRWGPEAGLPWLEVAARLEPEVQGALLAALLEPGVAGAKAGDYDLSIEPLIANQPRWRVQYLQGLAARYEPAFLMSGFRLLAAWSRPDRESWLQWPMKSGPVPEECLLQLGLHLEPEHPEAFFLHTLWTLCGDLPGFGELLASIPWMELAPAVAYDVVALLRALWDSEVEHKVRLRWWSVARRVVPPLLQQLRRTPASHQSRCVHMVHRAAASDPPPWDMPEDRIPTVLAFSERVCRPPFQESDRLSYALTPLLRHPEPEVRQRLRGISEHSLLAFERCCAHDSLAVLVGEGMALLVPHDAKLVLEALERFPELLGRTMQLLGTPRRNVGREVMAEYARHPLVREDPFTLPPERMVALLREHCVEGVESPLPRKARLALEEGRGLPPGQIERALRVASEGLVRLRLQVLARLVLRRLRGALPADARDTRVRHALQMASLINRNHRALRRLLARYFSGERDFVTRHPLSREWFERHPRVDAERWLKGLVLRREVPGVGPVTLAVEQDALEALRLGTLVGTCLGLNGVCDDSAASVVLDVNKRVLYARDARGQVVARQLLAISKEDQLVPFNVYPERAPPALQDFFLDYDLAFAEALGLPLSDGPLYPDVENVLSESFWHDGAWELGGREEEPP